MKNCLKKAICTLLNRLSKLLKKNCRGEAIQFHFGYWGKRVKKGYITETVDSKAEVSKYFYLETIDIWMLITKLIQIKHPKQYERLMKVKQFWNCQYTWGLWHTLAYNFQLQSKRHIDDYDDLYGICIIIPIGEFTGGEIIFHDFNIEFECQFGDIFIGSSAQYYHSNKPIIGNRDSIVLFNCCYCTEVINSDLQ